MPVFTCSFNLILQKLNKIHKFKKNYCIFLKSMVLSYREKSKGAPIVIGASFFCPEGGVFCFLCGTEGSVEFIQENCK